MAHMPAAFDQLDLCDRVRQSCRRVVAMATLVHVDDNALDVLAGDIATDRVPVPLEEQRSLGGDLTPEEIDRVTLVLALDAINFGSGYHDVVRKRPGLSGSQTMARSLEDYVEWTGPLVPARLRRMTVNDCSQIFGQDLDGGAQEELMGLFAIALVDLGQWIEASGGTAEVMRSAAGSAERLAEQLTDMAFYRDVETYRGAPVSFYKRAQITPADIARRVRPDLFSDLHRMTAFADNLVPHVLRVRGVLHYDPELASLIDGGVLLDPGGDAEIEIRAAGVECVERLAVRTGRRAMDIDATLWTMGSRPEFKSVRRHRTRTVFY